MRRQHRVFRSLILVLLLPAGLLAQGTLWKTYTDAGTEAFQEGRYAEAERRFNLARKEAESFGLQDSRLALSYYNLALVHLKQEGKLAEALKHSRQALAIWEKVVWEKKPRTESLEVANNLEILAGALLNSREYTDIELLLKQSLTIRRKVLRPEHPTIATTLGYLAITNFLQKKHAESDAHYLKALEIFDKARDAARYVDVIQGLRNFALINQLRGNSAKAEEFLYSAIELRQKSREPEYTDSDTWNALADLYNAQHRYADAEKALRRRLEITERAYGTTDPHVAPALDSLAIVYMAQEKYAAAAPLAERALVIQEKALSPEHVGITESLNRLAKCYYYLGEYNRAEPLYLRAISISQKSQGQPSADVDWYKKNYALLLYAQGKKEQAEPLFQEVLATFSQSKRDRDVGFSLYELADLYRRQKQYDEAEALFKKALPLIEKASGPDQYELAMVLEKYASLLREMGRAAEATPFETRAKEIKSK